MKACIGESKKCFPEVESILKYFAQATVVLFDLNANYIQKMAPLKKMITARNFHNHLKQNLHCDVVLALRKKKGKKEAISQVL